MSVQKFYPVLQKERKPLQTSLLSGVIFTFLIALAGTGFAKLPVINHLGPMVISILLAMLYRQTFGYPQAFRIGIQFSVRKLLRFAIVLFGFKLNLSIVLSQGFSFLARDAASIVLALVVTWSVAKLLKADPELSFLLGVGTGVCGAAAIAAVSPLVKAKDEDTAIGVAMIALTGTVFTVIYTLLFPLLGLSASAYGLWSGISLHEIAHVAAAAAPAGDDALALALLAKLGRVLLLIPLCFCIILWRNRVNKKSEELKLEFPWFLIGFLLMAAFSSLCKLPQSYLNVISQLSSFLLTSAMVGLGLNIDLRSIFTKSVKPLIAMLIASIALSLFSFVLLP